MKLLALLLLVGAANAARQVAFPPPVAIPSPPPPPASPGVLPVYFDSPGFDFSMIIPGYTETTWTKANTAQLCEDIVSVNAPANTKEACDVSSATTWNGTSVLVNGYFYYAWLSTPTVPQIELAVALRDQTVDQLRQNSTLYLGKNFAGSYANCACSGPTTAVTASLTTDFSYSTNLTGLLGPVQCGAKLTYDTANTEAIINQVGVDDGTTNVANIGKFCSTPALDNGVVGVPGSGSCRQYGVVATPFGTTRATATVTVSNGVVQNPGTVTAAGSGYTSVPAVTLSAPNRVGASATFTWSGSNGALTQAGSLATATNGPYVTAPTGTLGGGTCVDTTTTNNYCTGATQSINVPGTPTTRTGKICRSQDFNSATGCNGGPCVTTTVGAGTTAINYPGTTGTVYCTATPTVTLDNNAALQSAIQAVGEARISSTSQAVTAVIITGGGSGYLTAPTVTIAPPGTGDLGKLCSASIIPGVGVTVSEGITTTGVCQPLGRDTQFNKVCSTPAVTGGLWRTLNTDTCNVISSFRNQPTPTDTNKCGVLKQKFTTSVIPGPSPPVVPPSPSPAVSPSPTASPPVVPPTPPFTPCSYRGTYEITPLYGPCNKYFIASGTDDNCSNKLVNLRTKSNLGDKLNRIRWTFATETKFNPINGIVYSDPTNVLANARTGCTNKYLAAPADPTTLKVGGSAWKWQFVPYPGSNKCDQVNMISENRLDTTAFLQVPRSCDRFRYNATDGGRQRFALKKV